jgi:alpha-1,2-mannosyltransferase
LWAAWALHRSGREFEGLMTCAVTALLVSPISWDHHWVWIAPILAIFVAYAYRGHRVAFVVLTGLIVLAFLGWPKLWNAGQGKGVIWLAPATGDAYGDNPSFAEYHWHGIELLEGNAYVLIGCVLLAAAAFWAWRVRVRVRSAAAHE